MNNDNHRVGNARESIEDATFVLMEEGWDDAKIRDELVVLMDDCRAIYADEVARGANTV